MEGAVLENGDGRGVGQRLGDASVDLVEGAGVITEEVERPDHLLAQADRKSMDRVVAGTESDRGEGGPSPMCRPQVQVDDGLTGQIAIQARSLLGLDLEQLDDPKL